MKILLTTDGSENSEKAAKFLTRLNFTPDDEIHILHAISWFPIISEWETIYDNLRDIKEKVVPRILDSTANILKPVKARISTSFTEDFPDKAITEKAVETGADLIVMGARGLNIIESHIVGSVTKAVANKSPRPVMVIKPPQWDKTGKIKILLSTDGSIHSDAAGKALFKIPFPDDTEITILNVITPALSDIPERFALEINDRIKNIVASEREREFRESEKIMENTQEYLSEKFSTVDELTKFGDPSLEIINAAGALGTDIIAVGRSGIRGIRKKLGSVSRYILNHAGCSVLVGKALQ